LKQLLIITSVLLCIYSNGQQQKCRYVGYEPIAIEKIEQLLDENFMCADSSGYVTSDCFERLSLSVDFYRVCYNKDSNDLMIIGRTDFPMVGIYLTDTLNKIPINSPIFVTSQGKTLQENGFFEISIQPKKGQFLFFYSDTRALQIRRYRIGELAAFLNRASK
jgi:hypothetical protein